MHVRKQSRLGATFLTLLQLVCSSYKFMPANLQLSSKADQVKGAANERFALDRVRRGYVLFRHGYVLPDVGCGYYA
jgi:hypothetical protein